MVEAPNGPPASVGRQAHLYGIEDPLMKKLFWAFALTLTCLSLPAAVHASGFGNGAGACGTVNFGLGVSLTPCFGFSPARCGPCGGGGGGGGGGAQVGPWYLYWPLEAHFQVPAPVDHYPY